VFEMLGRRGVDTLVKVRDGVGVTKASRGAAGPPPIACCLQCVLFGVWRVACGASI
jgi:hypothetical protein